jgi:hypothetical protein
MVWPIELSLVLETGEIISTFQVETTFISISTCLKKLQQQLSFSYLYSATSKIDSKKKTQTKHEISIIQAINLFKSSA